MLTLAPPVDKSAQSTITSFGKDLDLAVYLFWRRVKEKEATQRITISCLYTAVCRLYGHVYMYIKISYVTLITVY